MTSRHGKSVQSRSLTDWGTNEMTEQPSVWRLWFDDIRKPPDITWTWARTVGRAKELLVEYSFDECSLDHDMGLDGLDPNEDQDDPEYWDKVVEIANALNPRSEENGYDLVNWMIENEHVPPVVTIHSWNPGGASRMAARLVNAGFDCYIAPFKPGT